MTFTLTIELGNEAMQTGTDLARALREVAVRLERRPERFTEGLEDAGRIQDENGNTVGGWHVDAVQ
jgi:hypothetical protein